VHFKKTNAVVCGKQRRLIKFNADQTDTNDGE